jgi:hypothetical protein
MHVEIVKSELVSSTMIKTRENNLVLNQERIETKSDFSSSGTESNQKIPGSFNYNMNRLSDLIS